MKIIEGSQENQAGAPKEKERIVPKYYLFSEAGTNSEERTEKRGKHCTNAQPLRLHKTIRVPP